LPKNIFINSYFNHKAFTFSVKALFVMLFLFSIFIPIRADESTGSLKGTVIDETNDGVVAAPKLHLKTSSPEKNYTKHHPI